MLVLITGGARSGKTGVALRRLRELQPQPPWAYVATGEAGDEEMAARIARHRAERGEGWQTLELPRAPASAFSTNVRAFLLDCLTLWLSNRLLDGASDDEILDEARALADAARTCGAPVVMVTNEVGGGIVPETPLGRRFRDLAGWVNQLVAAAADEVLLVACGLPLRLK